MTDTLDPAKKRGPGTFARILLNVIAPGWRRDDEPNLALPLAAILVTSCIETQPPVNRVQPNVTRKADLLGGEWYLHQTVVDTSRSSTPATAWTASATS